MVSVKPLAGLRPRPEIASSLAAVPYDVVDTAQARQLAAGNPQSFLRITRSELELDEKVNPYTPEVYEHAKKNLEMFVQRGDLIAERDPSLYIYRLRMGEQVQTGVMGGVTVTDYDAGRIKIHEKTRPDKENDRVQHMLTLRAHAEPVFLAFRAEATLCGAITEETKGTPLYTFIAPDNIEHTVWKVRDSSKLSKLFESLPAIYIADGHHRAASAKRVTHNLRTREKSAEHELFLAVLFPHTELKILPYNRIIKRLPCEPTALLAELKKKFIVTENASPTPKQKGEFAFYLNRKWYGLKPITVPHVSDPVAALDISILSELALAPIFGITDQRTDKNIDFIGGIHGTSGLERLVDTGVAACAFSLFPVSIEELFSVADQEMLMAPKSTWFEPKLRSGLFVHTF